MLATVASRLAGAAIAVATIGPVTSGHLYAQRVTTAAISGTVRANEIEVEGVEVVVVNRATGFVSHATVRHGRFQVDGLEVGGPYSVTLRGIGLRPAIVDGLSLSLGQRLSLQVRLEPATLELPAIVVTGPPGGNALSPNAGLAAVVSDSDLHRLPSANHDLYDFVQLSPHVSTHRGLSGAGVSALYNSFQIDGAGEQSLHGRGPAGVAGGGKPISLEAIREYQVLIAPADVSIGDFAGTLINSVTRSGSNELHGSAFIAYRNEALARNVPLLRDAPYHRLQVGAWVGGPVVRDRVQFFIAGELQRLTSPVPGPYLGQPASSVTPLPASAADIDRFVSILRRYGLSPGPAGPVTAGNPLVNLFGRLDVALPAINGRLVLRHSYGQARDDNYFGSLGGVFLLSSYGYQQHGVSNVTTAELISSVGSGGSNQLTVDHYSGPIAAVPFVRSPEINVLVPALDTARRSVLVAGTPVIASRFGVRQHTTEVTDVVRLPLGRSHSMTLGGKLEFFGVGRSFVFMSYGTWMFDSLEALSQGIPSSFQLGKDYGGGDTWISGTELTAFVGDEWRPTERLSVVGGVRAEVPTLDQRPAFSPEVAAAFGRRTDEVPGTTVLVSPRLGVTWTLDRRGLNVVRAGSGLFTGRPPFGLWINAFANAGNGVRELHCGTESTDAGPPPPFDPSYSSPPQACANGAGPGPATVFLLDAAVRYPQSLRAWLSYERGLPAGGQVTFDAVYNRTVHDMFYVDRALKGPVGTDTHGRVLYGTIDSLGQATPRLVDERFPQVLDMVPQSHNYSWAVSVRLSKPLAHGFTTGVSYTFSRVRDALTMADALGYDLPGLPVSGERGHATLGVSDLDQPHRLVVVGTVAAPWKRWRTDLSLFYVGGSGAPFTLTALGDLNADGTDANDPIYLPRDVRQPLEIRFDGSSGDVAEQRVAFERLISGVPCLARQRGHIMTRNSCRGPWSNTLNLSLRQTLPSAHGQALSLELEIFNVLNLLNGGWGLVNTPNTTALEQVGQTAGTPASSAPIFRFDPAFSLFSTDDPASYYQLQAGMRYSF